MCRSSFDMSSDDLLRGPVSSNLTANTTDIGSYTMGLTEMTGDRAINVTSLNKCERRVVDMLQGAYIQIRFRLESCRYSTLIKALMIIVGAGEIGLTKSKARTSIFHPLPAQKRHPRLPPFVVHFLSRLEKDGWSWNETQAYTRWGTRTYTYWVFAKVKDFNSWEIYRELCFFCIEFYFTFSW